MLMLYIQINILALTLRLRLTLTFTLLLIWHTPLSHVTVVYNAHDCGKICSRLLFYDNQHASSCIKAVSNVGQSRVGLCKQVK